MRRLRPDLIFLQEVHGEHNRHAKRVRMFPPGSQFEYLAEEMWPHFSYGKNMVYSQGHHGNAILSRFPIVTSENIDVSVNRFERRGVLHAEIEVPGIAEPVHALCLHLGLLGGHRTQQLQKVAAHMKSRTSDSSRVIAAGDFNDWRKVAGATLKQELDFSEAFVEASGAYAKSFPSFFPLLCLDRVYYRGFKTVAAKVLGDPTWAGFSDHLALWVELAQSAPAACANQMLIK